MLFTPEVEKYVSKLAQQLPEFFEAFEEVTICPVHDMICLARGMPQGARMYVSRYCSVNRSVRVFWKPVRLDQNSITFKSDTRSTVGTHEDYKLLLKDWVPEMSFKIPFDVVPVIPSTLLDAMIPYKDHNLLPVYGSLEDRENYLAQLQNTLSSLKLSKKHP